MGASVWLHLTERHDQEHGHEELTHEHRHVQDEHHLHEHGPDDPPGDLYSHRRHHRAIIIHTHSIRTFAIGMNIETDAQALQEDF
jgi:hypothetical protein